MNFRLGSVLFGFVLLAAGPLPLLAANVDSDFVVKNLIDDGKDAVFSGRFRTRLPLMILQL